MAAQSVQAQLHQTNREQALSEEDIGDWFLQQPVTSSIAVVAGI